MEKYIPWFIGGVTVLFLLQSSKAKAAPATKPAPKPGPADMIASLMMGLGESAGKAAGRILGDEKLSSTFYSWFGGAATTHDGSAQEAGQAEANAQLSGTGNFWDL